MVVLTDGHVSKFDPGFRHFCHKHEIFQFLSPPGTTNFMQLNQFVNLDSSYRDLKGNLFLDETVNRGSFRNILSVCWGKWKTKESILSPARNF